MAETEGAVQNKQVTISLKKAQRHIGILWFVGFGLCFLIIILPHFFGRYGGDVYKIMTWYGASTIPSLIIIFVVLQKNRTRVKDAIADKLTYRTTCLVIIFYYFLILSTFFADLFSDYTIYQFLCWSHYYLGPMQGIIAFFLGAFFVNKKGSVILFN